MAANEATYYLILPDGTQLPYVRSTRPVKNINIRVRPDGLLGVSAPRSVSRTRLEALLLENRVQIQEALEKHRDRMDAQQCPAGTDGQILRIWGDRLTVRSRPGARNTVTLQGDTLLLTLRDDTPEVRRKLIEAFLAAESRARIMPVFHRVLQRFRRVPGFPATAVPAVQFRWMTSRWGSCRPAGPAITLNSRLLLYPPMCAEYVIVHELSHILQPNHSADFYRVMDAVMPDWAERRERLREKP